MRHGAQPKHALLSQKSSECPWHAGTPETFSRTWTPSQDCRNRLTSLRNLETFSRTSKTFTGNFFPETQEPFQKLRDIFSKPGTFSGNLEPFKDIKKHFWDFYRRIRTRELRTLELENLLKDLRNLFRYFLGSVGTTRGTR